MVTKYSGLKKKVCFRVMPKKKLGRVGTISFLKHVINFKSMLISHFKAMQFIEVCGATIFCDYRTFFCKTGFFLNAKNNWDGSLRKTR